MFRARPPACLPAAPALGALALLLSAGQAAAADWTVSGQVYSQLGYDDNVALATQDETASTLGIVAGSVNLRGRTPTLELGIDGEADLYRYFEESSLDTDNQLLRGFVNREGERAAYGVEATLRRDSSLVNQLDSGNQLQLDDERRNTFSVSPNFSYLLSPRDKLVTDGNYSKRTYPDSDRIDYSLWNGSVGWQRAATRRTTLGLNLYGSYFDSRRQQATFVSPQGYVGYKYAERLDFQLAVGPSLAHTESQLSTATGLQDESDTSLGYSFDLRGVWRATGTTQVIIGASRLLEPGGDDGQASETSLLRASVNQRLSPHLLFRFESAAQREVGVGNQSSFLDRDDLIIQPSLRWSLTQQVELSINYRLRYRQFDDGQDATGNAVFLRLSYDFKEVRASW